MDIIFGIIGIALLLFLSQIGLEYLAAKGMLAPEFEPVLVFIREALALFNNLWTWIQSLVS